MGVGSVGYTSLAGDILGVLSGCLYFADDVKVEVARGAFCPIGQCVLVDCEKENAVPSEA